MIELERTADGSYTLYVPELDEHYHSIKGALTESQHIFIEMGLKHSPAPEPRILEIGLGTGLNAFLTLLTAEEMQRKVHYTGIERYPIAEETLRKLDYPSLIRKGHEEAYYAIHQATWGEDTAISPWFTLHKVEGDFTRLFGSVTDYPQEEHPDKHSGLHSNYYSNLPSNSYADSLLSCHAQHCSPPINEGAKRGCEESETGYDIIYFDAFAPEKQPEMWEQTLFNALYNALNKGGILTTYCAKGVVRRMLQAAGFLVERLPGPPGGKREILRASK